MNSRRMWLKDSGLAAVDYVGGPSWGTEFAITDGESSVLLNVGQAEVLVAFILEYLAQEMGCEEVDFEQGEG